MDGREVIPMIPNALFWSHYIHTTFIPLVDTFSDCLKERVLPSFENLSQEANEVASDAWGRLGSHDPEGTDPGDFVDTAMEKGLEFYQTMSEMKQGVQNMFSLGLYHLFEQGFLFIHRRILLSDEEEKNTKLFNLEEASKRLAEHGIYIDQFHSWKKVFELKTLANAIKHADGRACEALKKLRPDLFCHPEAKESGPPYLERLKVFQPLAGESIYVTVEVFDEYVKAVKEFWSELIEALEGQGR